MSFFSAFLAFWLVGLVVGQVGIFLWLRAKLVLPQDEDEPLMHLPPVSIVIVARNEADNIVACLSSIVNNQYPHVEIILVDDQSTDSTVELARQMNIQYLRIISLASQAGGVAHFKKLAVRRGINAASYSTILTTDADCVVGHGWISSMIKALLTYDVVTGLIHIPSDRSILGDFQNMEMSGTMLATQAGIQAKKFYSANAASMAFSRDLFERFEKDRKDNYTASGDDIFLLHWAAQQGLQVGFNCIRSGRVETKAVATWIAFVQQRIRWAKKSKGYSHRNILYFLASQWFFQANIIFSILFVLFGWVNLGVFVLLLCTKLLVDFVFLGLPIRSFTGRFIILSILHSLYLFLLPIVATWSKSYEWKGRVIIDQ